MSAFLRCRLVPGLSIVLSLIFLSTANASVISQLQGRQLQVVGDSQSNSIAIAADSNWVVVTSTDTNPASVQQFPLSRVDKITVGTMGGGDQIEITSMLAPGNGSEKAVDVDVMAGAGDDAVEVNGYWGELSIFTASGADNIEIGSGPDGARIDRRLTVFAGKGDDVISLTAATVGKNARIRGGAGDDTVSLLDNTFQRRLNLHSGGGNDAVTFIDNQKETSEPFILRGGAGNNDSLSGKFDLADLNVNGFEEIVQIPDAPILITAVDRSTFAKTSYNSSYGPPPDNVINEFEQNELSTDQSGPWDGSVNASILSSYEIVAPIVASANHVSDVAVTGGTLDIDLFSDQYWGSQPTGFMPFGSANSASNYEVTFLVNTDVTLTVDGFLSTNRASAGYPLGFASFRLIERAQTDVTLLQRVVSPMSDVMFNDLVETLDGTLVGLEAGKTYSIVVAATGNSSATIAPSNAEAEVSLIWNIN